MACRPCRIKLAEVALPTIGLKSQSSNATIAEIFRGCLDLIIRLSIFAQHSNIVGRYILKHAEMSCRNVLHAR
jgi:hypothetical protein